MRHDLNRGIKTIMSGIVANLTNKEVKEDE